MPELQMTGCLQDEDRECGRHSSEIADHHHQLAVVAVHHHSCDGGEDQEWQDEGNLHQPHGSGAFGLFEHPD